MEMIYQGHDIMDNYCEPITDSDWKEHDKKWCFYARVTNNGYEPIDDDVYYGTEEEILNQIKSEGEDTFIRLVGKPKYNYTDNSMYGPYARWTQNFTYDESACWTLVETEAPSWYKEGE